jgi:methionine S-methyltransferase
MSNQSHLKSQIDVFIQQCQKSSSHAYQAFKQLLDDLEQTNTRAQAFSFLQALKSYAEQNQSHSQKQNQAKNSHFQFLSQTILNQNDQAENLTLLQFPSTFLPEAWSFTFYEGLVRYPSADYRNKKVVELGCGIGWISIALALRYLPEQMIGLDINPKAVTCARLNAYLNGLNDDGSEKILADGKSLISRLNFYESNLFSHFNQQQSNIHFDKIIGCIPQVLNPEPEVMETLIAETASDEYLHSLSNYFAKQGFIEDQFGLGLIASAVEQSIALLQVHGKLILNLGGRPGRLVLERLMQRRGFKVRRVWQTQVEQAADTEIDALVDIEKNTGHQFEFYMSSHADTPIDATTALLYAKAGGKIYHSVDVYEAKMLFPEQIKSIYESIDQMSEHSSNACIQGLRSAVDLTYDNIDDAEERYSFLAFLAKKLTTTHHFPYAEAEGLLYFRQQLAEYFQYYLSVNVEPETLIITPGRRQLLSSLLNCYQPRLSLISQPLMSLVNAEHRSSDSQIIQAPSQVEYLVELIEKLKPEMVITQLDHNEIQSSQLVERLITCANQHNVLLVLDLTENIDLSSQPVIHGVYRYLSKHALSHNVVLMAGLIKNTVYQNYFLNITLTANPNIRQNLIDAAELTYSRTPYLKQLYYAHLLESLLFFQRTRPTQVIESLSDGNLENNGRNHNEEAQASYALPKLSAQSEKAFQHPAIIGNHLNFNRDTVRLDFGENELAAPNYLKEVLFESYLVRKYQTDDIDPTEPLQKILNQRFNLNFEQHPTLVFGNGVAPIYSGLLSLCARQKQSLIIPSGSYGYFKAAGQYKDLKVVTLTTDESNDFKITPQQLTPCLQKNSNSWLFLNAPVVNPTGAIYSHQELKQLLSIAAEFNVKVIMDTIFSGLGFEQNEYCDLDACINAEQTYEQKQKSKLILIGGVSKEFSAGGLRFGYAWSNNRELIKALPSDLGQTPHFTLSYALRQLFEAQLNQQTDLIQHLAAQRETLIERANQLSQVLTKQGWQVIKPKGGLFLVAKPSRYIQANLEHKLLAAEDYRSEVVAAADHIAAQLFQQQNLVINNSTWTGLPGYCRFVLSANQADFDQAIERLKLFSL